MHFCYKPPISGQQRELVHIKIKHSAPVSHVNSMRSARIRKAQLPDLALFVYVRADVAYFHDEESVAVGSRIILTEAIQLAVANQKSSPHPRAGRIDHHRIHPVRPIWPKSGVG